MGDASQQAEKFSVDREEIIWAAGLWDGEGNSGFYGGKKKYCRTQITQKTPTVLHRFHRAVLGIGTIAGPYTYNGKTHYKWHAHGFPQCQAVFALLAQFLSPEKLDQFKRMLTAYHSRPADRRFKKNRQQEVVPSLT